MKRIVYISLGIFVLVLFVFTADAQDSTPTTEPLPTLSRDTPFWDVFPGNLYCYAIGHPFAGPTWGAITIGTSTVQDLKDYVATIGTFDSIHQWADYISFSRTGNTHGNTGIWSITSCVDMTTQRIIALSVNTINPAPSLQDLVAQYGIPDVVTWGNGNIDRTVFWFHEGIAASVYILEQYTILNYGEVGVIVYFPYQTIDGAETRWPYSYTNSENPVGGDYVYDPAPSELQNPFDFDAMIATITAQPSETPTPTFASPSSTLRLATITPTP